MNAITRIASVRGRVSAAEWEARVKLAAAYRLAARLRWTDHIYTHFSIRVPGPDRHFLINPYGLAFDEITASSLVKVDIDGTLLDDPTGLGINRAGYVIHSAIHRAREHTHAVLHTHTTAGIGVSAQQDGLLMISQHAMRFYKRLAYHDYEGIALDLDEQQRLIADIGEHDALILRNHGLLTSGRTIEEAFYNLYFLERACAAQLAAQSGGAALRFPSEAVAEKAARGFDLAIAQGRPQSHWDAYLRQLERDDPGFRL
ncbi:aldolase II superfamily protein [Azotobacter vinelandii CA]|uniref:Class II aldolase family protein n=2 Tax=Azotobacter vinelandii TaxID=354 RepID=C1DNU7_AZOVD|nr:class II aldolase/adducin family protein [Azotobacter vinelandii]ACO79300.1 Class II aldolase family protein [Azotobacter vinelandii DJ]AGK14734.1 aldolase II superfamily protein [Azotobacter vinelandii CA]AGK21106.1 aldolase II superfamily protein [Azotobacter vinelandii CA6]WKN20262.1 class II aldolase/adducin family protein [Azotobacter vinelandii]SFY19958.1 Ribulose-5-phosphate 4-epimerase/Fuculose-1-phosphate aldolase [Azotobacter vinelandii]